MSFFSGGDSTRRFLSADFLTPPELKVEPKNNSKSIKTKIVKAEKKDDKEPSPLNAILKNKKATKKDVHAYFENLIETFKDD
jgi:hypothetical protein